MSAYRVELYDFVTGSMLSTFSGCRPSEVSAMAECVRRCNAKHIDHETKEALLKRVYVPECEVPVDLSRFRFFVSQRETRGV